VEVPVEFRVSCSGLFKNKVPVGRQFSGQRTGEGNYIIPRLVVCSV